MEKIKDIKNFVLNIIKIIKLIFETAPFLVTKLVFCNVMLGIVVSVEYYGAAEPPVRCGESHLSGLTEPPHFVY